MIESMKKITQKQLARLLNVSQVTISRIVNNSPLVKKSLREKLLLKINKLGYAPNQAARTLRGGKTRMAGLVLPYFGFLEGYNTARIVNGLGTSAAGHDYSLIVTTFSEHLTARQTLQALIQKSHLDGIFAIVNSPVLDVNFSSFIQKAAVPVVFVNTNRKEAFLYSVGADNTGGVFRATTFLMNQGRRKIAFLGANTGSLIARERERGYRRALRNQRSPYCKIITRAPEFGSDLIRFGYQSALTALNSPKPPDAFICYSDHMAIGVLKAAQEKRLNIPRDLAVIGFGDIKEAAYTVPSLTTIREDGYEIGKKSMEIMAAILAGNPPAERHAVIPAELVLRGST